MKLSLTSLLILTLLSFYTKNKSQIFTSSKTSFKEGFQLIIESDSATLYGWDLNSKKDTIYFKTKGLVKIDSTGKFELTLDNYSYSNFKPSNFNFIPDPKIKKPILGNYNSFFGSINQVRIFACATKHSYDNKCDEFVFEK